MKGSTLGKVLQRTQLLVALFTVFRSSLALPVPPLSELHAMTDFAEANANNSMHAGGMLSSWIFTWDSQGNWTGGNPCTGTYQGLRCLSKGNLKVLRAPPAALQGFISPALGKLTYLRKLVLGDNQLSGDIDQVLGKMSSMKTLRLQGNQFTGSLSNWIPNMPQLEELRLARNSLAGNISTGVFTNLTHLSIIDLSSNNLSGPIPDDLISQVPSLQQLSLDVNKFTGKLPKNLTMSSILKTVNLSRNSLNGNLPSDWNMPNLTNLDLSWNNLSGPIPPALMNLSSITRLNLAQNNFTGNVSSVHTSKFGCNAFAGNPGLIIQDSRCSTVKASPPACSPCSPALTPPVAVPPPLVDSKKSLSTLTIVALTMGDVALIIMSVVGLVVFCIWWRKKDIDKEDVGDTKQWNSIASKEDQSSKDINGNSYGGHVVTGPGPTSAARSSFAAKPDVNPVLKSVVGIIRDPTKDFMTADTSFSESVSISDFGANMGIFDTTLALEFEDLLSAKALVLGAGSFGLVYLACLEDGEMLAIKKIEELALPDQRVFGKKCAELAEVLHPNLLQLRAYCWSPLEKLLVFDYMQNGSVHSLLHEGNNSPEGRKSIDWATRLNIAVGTARAVAHLHDSDTVHGNIKASNVLLDEHFEPRVSDFGLEMLLQMPLQQHTSANDGYLAPELTSSVTRRKTQEGDVYSLGVFLLELLTGREPGGSNNVDLPTWVQEMISGNRKVQLFDPALTSMHVLPAKDILEFLELAQACVSADAAARPSITIVLRSLESIVPGSTAPRSYVKDENIDSDASFHNTPDNISLPGFIKSIEDGDNDDDGSYTSFETPFSPGFMKPVRVQMTPEQKAREESREVGSPVSSVGSFYSNLSTPTSSQGADEAGFSSFKSTRLLETHESRK